MHNNPLTVKDGKKAVGVIPIPPHSTMVQVVVKNEESKVLLDATAGSTFHSIPLSAGKISVFLSEKESGKAISSEFYDLTTKFGIAKKEVDNRKEKLMERIMGNVKEEMDNPVGSAEEVEYHTDMLSKTTMSEDARHYVESKILQVISKDSVLSEEEAHEMKDEVYAHLYGMGVIQKIDDDPEVGEILVNGYVYPTFRCEIYYIKNQKKVLYDKTFKTYDEMYNVFSRAIAFSKKELNNVENARVEAMRSNRDRVNIFIPDASESYIMNIRKFGNFVPTADSMKKSGTVTDYMNELLGMFVRGKANIGIGGEMGTGKTTAINYLLTHTNPIELKAVVSSVAETDVERVLKGHHVIILNVDEEKGFTFANQMNGALRTTASRIIIPESRGKEFRQVYEANLKTKGNMFTAHALDDHSFLDMCVDMYMGDAPGNTESIRNRIANSINIIVIMRIVGNTIRIKSISEILKNENREYIGMNVLNEWVSDPEDATKGYYRKVNAFTDELAKQLNGYGVPMSEIRKMQKEATE